MTAARNAAALEAYGARHDTSYLTDDAVFTDMNSGQRSVGADEVGGMLHWFYNVAFDARFEQTSAVVDDEMAAIEGLVVGRHIGEFAGVPPTGRDIRVPLAVVYRFSDGKIASADIYFAVGAFLAQVSAVPA